MHHLMVTCYDVLEECTASIFRLASLVQADAAVEGNVFVIQGSFRKFDQLELQRVGRANGT